MSLKEQLTPHKLSLLVLIKEYALIRRRIRCPDRGPEGPIFCTAQSPSSLRPSSPVLVEKCRHQGAPQSSRDSPLALTETEMTSFMVAILKLIQSSDLDSREFLSQMKEFCPLSLIEIFTEKLTEIHDGGLQMFMNFFQQLTTSFFAEGDILVRKTSVIGLFVRRLALCYETMSFTQVAKFFSAFKLYFQCLVGGDDNSMDCTLDITLPDVADNKPIHYSQRQAEFFILQQANYLQYNPQLALPPGQLQAKIKQLFTANPALSEAHYLTYLNCLRTDEYCGAIDSLYHYFDRNQFKNREEEDVFKGYRYAILNLAALHFRFGQREEALMALQEAMGVAQEYNDQVCLQHALSWLRRLGHETPLTKKLDKIDNNLAYLTSLNVQVMTRKMAVDGENPGAVFDYMSSSDWLNSQHNLTGLTAMSHVQKSGLWTLYGNRLLPVLFSQVTLNLHGNEHGIQMYGESSTVAKCTIARSLCDMGKFNAAFTLLNSCYSDPHRDVWQLTELILKFDQFFHEGKFSLLEGIIEKIKSLDPLEGRLREAIYLKEIGDTEKSMEMVMELKKVVEDDVVLLCRVVLVLTELCCQIGDPVGSVDALLSSMVLCEQNHLLYYHSLTAIHLAYVQFCLNLPTEALNLIEKHLVTILNLGSAYDKARCLYLYSKCRVSAYKEESARRHLLLTVTQTLSQAGVFYQAVGNSRRVKDLFYYQARLYHELGFISERNKFAIEFRKLDSLYPTLTPMSVNTL